MFVTIAFMGCSKSSSDVIMPDENEDYISAKIAGFDNEFFALISVYEDHFSLFGCNDNYEMRIVFPNTVGTHQISELPNSAEIIAGDPCCIYPCDIPTTSYIATSGMITVTSLANNIIKGTFFFTAEHPGDVPRVVEDGIFEAKY